MHGLQLGGPHCYVAAHGLCFHRLVEHKVLRNYVGGIAEAVSSTGIPWNRSPTQSPRGAFPKTEGSSVRCVWVATLDGLTAGAPIPAASCRAVSNIILA